jgi:hypothetical protein
VAALCERLGDMTTLDDYDTDDDEYNRQVYTAKISHDNEPTDDDEDDTITIRAHLEYTKSGDRHYAISDSGADLGCPLLYLTFTFLSVF